MSEAKEHPCPDCQEMVRVNSLRCWNCGAFMNPELEEKYLEMQSKPQETIYSDLPQEEVSSLEENTQSSGGSSDDDFELSMPTASAEKSEETSSDTGGIPVDPNNPDAPAPRSEAAKGEDGITGDALLNIALQDEKQLQKQRRKRAQRGGMTTPGGGLIIFCPYGCRIVVKESHRGMQGKCPECRAPFIVPIDPPDYRKTKTTESAEDTPAAAGEFSHWLQDLHLHTVNPEKLKLKADSLLKDFVAADFGFSDNQILSAVFGKKSGGRFGSSGTGKEDPRDALKKQLQEGTKIEALDLAEKIAFDKESISQLKVVQPAASRSDSIFHGIPVFGAGRIAVQLPATNDQSDVRYVSMGITQFWELKKIVEEKFGLKELGAGIPSEQIFSTHRCHYLETQIKALDDLDLYKADETVELETVGYQCGKCQATVSEEGRKRESLGGKSPKGIAKAKCPKCGNKMGDNLLCNIKVPEEPATSDAS